MLSETFGSGKPWIKIQQSGNCVYTYKHNGVKHTVMPHIAT